MELQFTFTEQEINLVLQALAELPAKVSMGLIMGIQAKAQQQIEQAQATVTTKSEDDSTPEEE